jgi:type I restriction enzyme, S subunit
VIKELPLGWASVKLEEIADFMDFEREPINSAERSLRIEGKDPALLFPYYGATGQIGFIDNFRTEGARILLGEDGAPFLDKNKDKAYLVNGRFWVNNHAHVLQGAAGLVNNKFLCYQLNLIDYQPFVSGTTRLKLTSSAMKKLPLVLAPLKEQERIANKLEELFSDLNAGVEELKAAQSKLAQYRQSLLKSAVEGTLTAEWRVKNIPKESGKEFLQRILKERRKNWEEKQLAKYKEQNKELPKGWQSKYSEPVKPDTKDLPKLPNGWVWTSLDMLGDIVSGVAKGSKKDSSIVVREVAYLRVANVQRGYLDLKEIKTLYATEKDINELILRHGDVLFNEGGDRDKLGRGWVWRDEVENCIHQNHVFRMRPFFPEVISELVSHYGNTFGKTWFQRAGKQTTNLASINMSILRSFPVPLAPADEQIEILSLLNSQVRLLDIQEDSTKKALLQSDSQRKNILKSAFSGQLVSQDVKDEHASVLLELIKKERLKNSSDKNLKIKGKIPMKKNIHERLSEWINSRDNKPFSFEDISKSISSEYEQIKDALFNHLSERKPLIEQVFDEDSGQVLFKKVKQ